MNFYDAWVNLYYDPATGQWLRRDPITSITQEPYNYAGNNPLNEADPTGLFHYTFNYDLGASDLTAAEFMSAVAAQFGDVFPIHGRAAQLTGNGQRMNLNFAGIPGPVEVARMTSTGWRFNTEPPHGDYPGWIDFNFSQTADCHSHLSVHAYVPDYSAVSLGAGEAGGALGWLYRKRLYRTFAGHLWGQFAHNLREFNQGMGQ